MDAFSLPLELESTSTESGDTDAVDGALCFGGIAEKIGAKDGELLSSSDTKKIDRGLTLRQRLRKNSEYNDTFNEKCSFVGKFVVMLQRHSDDSSLRVGVIASKRTLRRAVDRNRAKRLMREAYRLNRHLFCGKLDVVLIARRPIAKTTLIMVEKDLLRLARKAGMLA